MWLGVVQRGEPAPAFGQAVLFTDNPMLIAREAANVAGLRVAVGGDRLGGADGALDCGGAAFRAEAARDGQSVRFFVLRAEEAAPDDMPVDEAPCGALYSPCRGRHASRRGALTRRTLNLIYY